MSNWENQHLSWIMYTWAALKEKAKILWTITEPCLNLEFLRGDQRNYHSLKIFVFLHGLMTWLVVQRSVCNDVGKQDDSAILQSIYSMYR